MVLSLRKVGCRHVKVRESLPQCNIIHLTNPKPIFLVELDEHENELPPFDNVTENLLAVDADAEDD